MVFIWSSGWGPRRRRRGQGGYGPGYGPGYGRGYGYGPPPGYGYRRGYGGGGGGGSCLRDLLLLNAGCCIAEGLGCGGDAFLLAPTTLRHVHASAEPASGIAQKLIAAIRVYQRDISPTRPPVCHFTPSCSQYAVEALEQHGARRGTWLALRRLVRCRPGAAGGADPVPRAD
jgi:putative membrane protein insertion efficiency factor